MSQRENPPPSFDPRDPRFSAYVLGELDSEAREEVEALIRRDPAARALVDELRDTAHALRARLREEPVPALRDDQRRRIETEVRLSSATIGSLARPAAAALLLFAAAAGLHRFPPAAGVEEVHVTARYEETEIEELEEMAVADGFATVVGLGGGGAYAGPGDSVAPTAGWKGKTNKYAGRKPSPASAAARARGLGPPPVGPSAPGPAGSPAPARRLAELGYISAGRPDAAPHEHLSFEPETRERYQAPPENPFVLATDDPLSTFSIDVDTASYTNARRHLLREDRLPPPDSVRLEEFVNYFRYDDPAPVGDVPFSVTTEVASCPWRPRHQLVRIGLKGREIEWKQRPASNLVFLIDVSGSMNSPNKLPLLVRSLKLLVEQLDARDSVAIVVYAGASGLALEPTRGDRRAEILFALDQLRAGGSTNGGEGIRLAYRVAGERFIQGGVNRVILCTDGDFNVGVSSRDELVELIEEQRESGVFLSVLGFGTGNLNDDGMEQLADKGNGSYAYIDSLQEGRRVLVDQIGGTMLVIAKDVKIQVAFNPQAVRAWRLLGYENRVLAHEDFDDDSKDAGEIGAGITCTALYEIVPHGQPLPEGVEPRASSYPIPAAARGMVYDELLLLRLRYKEPQGTYSRLLETRVRASQTPFHAASEDMRFAGAVAAFAMLLRDSAHRGAATFDDVYTMAYQARGDDPGGYRLEFLEMVEKAREISSRSTSGEGDGR